MYLPKVSPKDYTKQYANNWEKKNPHSLIYGMGFTFGKGEKPCGRATWLLILNSKRGGEGSKV